MKAVMFPGQGSQYKGMGKDLFKIYKSQTERASEILGYDLEELCLLDPKKELGQTRFTQPAIYTVNALTYFDKPKLDPSYLIGHSLGEYNALLAAGVFDFETGLKLVKKRGELMSEASGGGMAAVLGISIDSLRQRLDEGGYVDIDIANLNTPTQIVISGPQKSMNQVVNSLISQKVNVIPLNVSAPFHSRYMKGAAQDFANYLKDFTFSPLKVPVIANITAQPYSLEQIGATLSAQIAGPVQWTDTIRFLMGLGVEEFQELTGSILTRMLSEIRRDCTPIVEELPEAVLKNLQPPLAKREHGSPALHLGSKAFRESYGVKYAYVAGSMYRGIASARLVIRMAQAGMLSFFGTGGLSLEEIQENIRAIQRELVGGEPFGVNLLHQISHPEREMQLIDLCISYGVKKIEASAFMQITPALVYFKAKGIRRQESGNLVSEHRIMAKLSRPEVAQYFLSPAPRKILDQLVEQRLLTANEALDASQFPMADDICVEADSGGHTDGGVSMVLLPNIQKLRERASVSNPKVASVRIGLAGGIGTPQAVACAFVMGADFVLTGSINQCTAEAGISDAVKDLLQDIDIQDTAYAPAGDMFEIGARVQVMKKGVLFPTRANKLYTLYTHYDSLDELPDKVRFQLERDFFKKSIDDIIGLTMAYLVEQGRFEEVERAQKTPKLMMALVFRWYFRHTIQLAFEGAKDKKINFQIHTGPALGAFNQMVKGTSLENWRNRHADKIGVMLMEQAADFLSKSIPNF